MPSKLQFSLFKRSSDLFGDPNKGKSLCALFLVGSLEQFQNFLCFLQGLSLLIKVETNVISCEMFMFCRIEGRWRYPQELFFLCQPFYESYIFALIRLTLEVDC